MNRLKNWLLLAVASVTLVAVLPAVNISAQSPAQRAVCEGVGLTGSNDCNPADDGNTVYGVVRSAINLLSIVVGVAAVIMLIIGGLKFITAQGESSSVASARATIIYSIIGLVIVLLAQVIVRFVISETKATPPSSQGPASP